MVFNIGKFVKSALIIISTHNGTIGKENLIVKQLSHKLFSASHNSHLSAAFLMYHSPDFLKNQNNSLAFFGKFST